MSTCEHNKHYNPQRPDVGLEPWILFPLADFGCHVARSPAARLQLLTRVLSNSESKVNESDIIPVVDDDILHFQVAMDYRLFRLVGSMKILETLAELLGEKPSLVILHRLVSSASHVLVQADSWDILLDQIDVFAGFKMVVEFADVGMG